MAKSPFAAQVFPRMRLHAAESMADAAAVAEIIVDCPYCNHAWKADLRWISGPCPNCGLMVYRYTDPHHD